MTFRLLLLVFLALAQSPMWVHAESVQRKWADLMIENLNGRNVELEMSDGRTIAGKCVGVGANEIRIRLSDPPKDIQSFPAQEVHSIRVFRRSGATRALLTIAGAVGGMFLTAAAIGSIGEGNTGRRQVATIYGVGAAGGVAGYWLGGRIRKVDRTLIISR